MNDEFLLLNPGPVPVTRAVHEATAGPTVSHRSAEFEAVYERAAEGRESGFERWTPPSNRGERFHGNRMRDTRR